MAQKPEYRTAEARSKHRDALNAEIESHLKDRSSAQWIERLNEAGVPCGPIYSIDQVFADPQVRHLGIAQKVAGKPNARCIWSASRYRCRGRRRVLRRDRRNSASTRMRCSKNLASSRARSPRCIRRRRCSYSIVMPGRDEE